MHDFSYQIGWRYIPQRHNNNSNLVELPSKPKRAVSPFKI
jgi:hypothetical protein